MVDCDVLVNLPPAVTRLTQTGQRMGPQQGVTIDEALSMFTPRRLRLIRGGQQGDDHPGKLADLVVLSGDPRALTPEALPSLSLKITALYGRFAFER